MSQVLPKQNVDLCIITTCELSELKKRLTARKYSDKKIEENMQAEIMEVIKGECEEKGYPIVIINTSRNVDLQLDDLKES